MEEKFITGLVLKPYSHLFTPWKTTSDCFRQTISSFNVSICYFFFRLCAFHCFPPPPPPATHATILQIAMPEKHATITLHHKRVNLPRACHLTCGPFVTSQSKVRCRRRSSSRGRLEESTEDPTPVLHCDRPRFIGTRRETQQIFRQLVMVSTHRLTAVQATCEHIIIQKSTKELAE